MRRSDSGVSQTVCQSRQSARRTASATGGCENGP